MRVLCCFVWVGGNCNSTSNHVSGADTTEPERPMFHSGCVVWQWILKNMSSSTLSPHGLRDGGRAARAPLGGHGLLNGPCVPPPGSHVAPLCRLCQIPVKEHRRVEVTNGANRCRHRCKWGRAFCWKCTGKVNIATSIYITVTISTSSSHISALDMLTPRAHCIYCILNSDCFKGTRLKI